jgi:hypothetical protein
MQLRGLFPPPRRHRFRPEPTHQKQFHRERADCGIALRRTVMLLGMSPERVCSALADTMTNALFGREAGGEPQPPSCDLEQQVRPHLGLVVGIPSAASAQNNPRPSGCLLLH